MFEYLNIFNQSNQYIYLTIKENNAAVLFTIIHFYQFCSQYNVPLSFTNITVNLLYILFTVTT